MISLLRLLSIAAVAVGLVTPAWAQVGDQDVAKATSDQGPSSAGREESGKVVAGTQLPAADDLPGTVWSEFLEDWLTPRPVPKKGVIFLDDGLCYPHVTVSFKMEVVKVEGDTVWVRGLPPEDPESPLHTQWLKREKMEAMALMEEDARKRAGLEDHVLDFDEPIVPPPTQDGLRFEEVRSALPSSGSWQMGFRVADMNEDGMVDLVFPPPRKGPSRPFIFLGDGEGGFSPWGGVRWPRGVPWDYGDVEVVDFDGDGHLDLAFAIHFRNQYVVYGDGNGGFDRFVKLPTPDPRITSRALGSGDFDGDGRPDLVFLAELDYDLGKSAKIEEARTVWIVRNEGGSSWSLAETSGMDGVVIGDALEVADLDRDGRPDLVLACNSTGWRRFVLFNEGEGQWRVVGNYNQILSNALHFDVAVPDAQTGRGAEIYAPFTQFMTLPNSPTVARTGVVLYRVQSDYVRSKVLTLADEKVDPYFRVAVGDINGDGLTDLVTSRKEPELEVYIQTVGGDFYREISPEVVPAGRAYDYQLVDLDGDGMDDIVGGFAPRGDGSGGIHVWLTRRDRAGS